MSLWKIPYPVLAAALLAVFAVGEAAAYPISPARKASASPPPAIMLRTDDLDLRNPAGAQTLRARVRHAAWKQCGETELLMAPKARRDQRACRAEAEAEALRALENSGLLAKQLAARS